MSNLIINIPKKEREDGRTPDSIKYGKHCDDFICLNDGTIMGEHRYCNLSTMCRQSDLVNGKPVPMENHYLPVKDMMTGEILEWQYFCTGQHDIRPLKERIEDDKAS